jgi:hypothetical protein
MIRGHLDSLTPGGFAEGWAYDDATPEVLLVRVQDPAGAELALGHANHYRGDLAEVGFRHGWCAFRLRLARPTASLKGLKLALHEATTGAVIHATDAWKIRDAVEPDGATLDAVVAQDPTVLRHVRQLDGCGDLLARFVAQHGVEHFIRTAYGYVLSRPPDGAGLASYDRLLRNGAVTPLGLLLQLAESAEFREQPRLLASPSDPGFVFAA